MRVLVTGTAGRVGRAIYIHLMKKYEVVGADRVPASTVDFVGDLRDMDFMCSILKRVNVVVHTAALHAPHVGIVKDSDFVDVNVNLTESLLNSAEKNGVRFVVYTSTTALYGGASTPEGRAGWINEKVTPEPRTIYHRTKIEAERILEKWSMKSGVPVTVLQMSRCFPESADLMALYRLNRGVDARDVASAHGCAIKKQLKGFNRFIISASTPFNVEHCGDLYYRADELVKEYAPDLAEEFKTRCWILPTKIDRVYDSSEANSKLNWKPKHGFRSVLEMLDAESSEVLPVL